MAPKIKKYGHAKFIFIVKDTYYSMAVMLDNGKVQYSNLKFAAKPVKMISSEIPERCVLWKFKKFNDTFSKYFIDEKTDIVITSISKASDIRNDLFFHMLRFMKSYSKCKLLVRSVSSLVSRYYSMNRWKDKRKKKGRASLDKELPANIAMCHITKIFGYLYEDKICPWINSTYETVMSLPQRSRRKYEVIYIGLYYMCIKDWVKNYNETKLGIKQQSRFEIVDINEDNGNK